MRCVWAAVPLALLAGIGCGDDEDNTTGNRGSGGTLITGGCEVDPSDCAAGTTCWVDDALTSFSCEPSGSGQEGELCVNQSGEPTCGDGLYCLQVQGEMESRCGRGCNPNAPPSDCTCAQVTIGGTELTFYACVPGTMGQGGS